MPDVPPHDEAKSTLEEARERLYASAAPRRTFAPARDPEHAVPHAWKESAPAPRRARRRVKFAGIFLGVSFLFFLVAAGLTGLLFYYGGNAVSVNNLDVEIQGPTSVAGGDTVPLTVAITNRNPAAIDNATLEIDFPDGTRSATDVTQAYPRYTEDLGTVESGATVTRTVKAAIFGAAGESFTLPVTLSYSIAGSSATFVKKSSYGLALSSTPLSVSVGNLAETVSGQPLSFDVTVRNNATTPIPNVVLAASYPFGFTPTSTSVPATGSNFLLGTLAPGASEDVTIIGTLTGQDGEQRVFHFSIGTAAASDASALAVTYMTQDANVSIAAPFIATTLSLGGGAGQSGVIAPGAAQSAAVTYTNTLSSAVTNASVSVQISGSAVDYSSITSPTGFYRSSDHTIVFSGDPSLASLAPGASGTGSFSFSTLPASAGVHDPTVTFAISVAGTRIGESNVPEQVSASVTQTAKVETAVAFSAAASHAAGPLANTGPIPPVADEPTTYTIALTAQNSGSAVAGAAASTVLPLYVNYTGQVSGAGSMSYDAASRTVTWNAGDLPQGGSVSGAFQVSLTPSSSQSGTAPTLTGIVSFSGYDRFAGVSVSASAQAVTTATPGDPGYAAADSLVH